MLKDLLHGDWQVYQGKKNTTMIMVKITSSQVIKEQN